MESVKIANLLDEEIDINKDFATRKWYIFNDESRNDYTSRSSKEIKYVTNSLKTHICDFRDAYIEVTGDFVSRNNDDTADVFTNNEIIAFKNCNPFRKCIVYINKKNVEIADHLNLVMPMYNVIENSDNFANTVGSLWNFKRDEIINLDNDITNSAGNNSPSSLISKGFKTSINNNVVSGHKNVKIFVPLKYLSNFFRYLETPLVNCNLELTLEWSENCLLRTSDDAITFKITNTRLFVPVVTLSINDNDIFLKKLKNKLTKRINWNSFKVIRNRDENNSDHIRQILETNIQGVNRLFVLCYLRNDDSDENTSK